MHFKNLLLGTLAVSMGTTLIAGDLTVVALDQKELKVNELVLWLDPLDSPAPSPPPGVMEATVEQIDEEFDPYTIAVRKGTKVNFPNRDAVQHHVYSLARPAQFEIPLHGGDVTESVVMEKTGIVPVGCNIHDWMLSYVVVVDTPWFATTGESGEHVFSDLPAGRYQLSAWHPRLRKAEELEVVVTEDGSAAIELTLRLRPDRRIRRAPTSGGSKY
ncbi:MAG: methylamine utilization protein [Synoicihabitans sp.]